ncbi:phosphoadenosine phosphosulfate reductase [Phaffia rhodozyma]|uniref:Phosphoadenosine phosphosulfate reductase n=1 Tax=Phaffia rhodozyma TaxID=264483 RepID=A0A0F7SMT8_PHARH|nr:phosphoadenosine phosphosulfate reductase [Phaffia rhodozyma]
MSISTTPQAEQPSPVAASTLFTSDELVQINEQLAGKSPQQILEWAIDNIPEGALWQTTAFGLTGLAATSMISSISLSRDEPHLVPLIFLDTLYHFPSTLALASQVEETYLAPLHVFKPVDQEGNEVEDAKAFEQVYGEKLWEREEDMYDYLVKVEPSHRAYAQLGVKAVLTGRRRSQGAERAALPVVEIDSTGLLKINPLIEWSFGRVKEYIDAENVPYNFLLDQGYKSIGDWHSTATPSSNPEAGERSGRWAGQKAKTECGLHKDYFKMKKQFEKKAREAELKRKDEAKDLEEGAVKVEEVEISQSLAGLVI